MSRAILYAANSTSQPFVATGTTVNFGNVVRRYGSLALSGGNPTIQGVGYYNVDTNLSFTPSGAGTVTIQVYKDGVAVPGALITRTVVADTSFAFTIPCVVREACCCESTITVVISGVAGNISNAAIVVEKE